MRDVLIVGGGIIGLLSALELSDRGRKVTVLDAGREIPPASWAGGGILSPLFPWRYPDAVTRLSGDAVSRYQALVDRIESAGLKTPELDRCGLLVARPDDWREAGDWAVTRGVPMRTLEAATIQPGLSFSEGLFFPRLGAVRNPGLLAGLRDLLRLQGVTLREEKVLDIDAGGSGPVVTTAAGSYQACDVLVAAGKASAAMLRRLGHDLPLFPVKGQMLMYSAVPGQLRTVVLNKEGYLIPRRDGRVLAGSTLEPGEDSVVPSRSAGEDLHRRALALWPELRGCPIEAQWAGVRPGCQDDVPWIGAVPGCPGIWMATGHYRNGLVSAPVTAALIAALVSGEEPPLDPAPYDPGSRI